MKTRILILTLIICACVVAQTATAGAIKIYLPREVNMTGEVMLLGDVALIRGNAEDVAKASAVSIGKFSVPGQKITVSRRTILTRLVANKVASKEISFSGSKDIKVGRRELVVSAKDITAHAIKFLEDNKTDATIASYELIKKCKNIVFPSVKEEITLVPRMGSRVSTSQISVDIDVMLNGKKVGSSQVAYRPMYNCRRIIARKDVPAGSVLSSNNIKIETYISKYPEAKGWRVPVGLVAKRNLKVGQQIRNSLLAKVKPVILIKRNALVVIKIETAALSLTADGKAIGQGAFGELIRVRNIRSKRIVLCKVNFDGTVSPAI
jgi:flagella basal body P-ring formation protein FlgA